MDHLPRAGWYDDPEISGQQRWWDGTEWSWQRRVLPHLEATPSYVTDTMWLVALGTIGVAALAGLFIPMVPGRPWTGVALIALWLVLAALWTASEGGASVSLGTVAKSVAGVAAVVAGIGGIASVAGNFAGGGSSGGGDGRLGDEALTTVSVQMDRCWREVIWAAPGVDALDTASPEVVNTVTRVTLVACMDGQTQHGVSCNTEGCFDTSGHGRSWDTIIEDWVAACWGRPADTVGC